MAEKYYPIVYVRGYAMTDGEVEGTFNNPYYGFNLGSTQYKMTAVSKPGMHIFESPVVRLMKEEGYRDSFNKYVDAENTPIPDGVASDEDYLDDQRRPDWRRTLWIFRFYDRESELFGSHERPKLEGYAADLAIFLNQIREACGNPEDFAVFLVAHSMGGLICRCYLQNGSIVENEKVAIERARELGLKMESVDPVRVHKFFTFGTPHKGISFRPGLGWAETARDLVGYAGSDTFGEREMRRFLKLGKEDLHTYFPLSYAPPLKRVFSLVGTNYQDYVVRSAKVGVGPGSDGLVAIENAYIKGAPRAFVHRAHSGPLGIVNSEAGYQNLCRFLFGDGRFKLFFHPGRLEGKLPGVRDGDDTLENYFVNMNVTIRGLPSYIHTRAGEHLSAMIVPVVQKGDAYWPRDSIQKDDINSNLHLYTGYFQRKNIAKGSGFSCGAMDLRIEPHYRHDGFIRDTEYEGDWLMNDRLRFGVSESGKIALEWASEEGAVETVTRGDVISVPFPKIVRDRFFPEGKLLLAFDEWD